MISLLIIAPIFVVILGNIGTDNEYFRFSLKLSLLTIQKTRC